MVKKHGFRFPCRFSLKPVKHNETLKQNLMFSPFFTPFLHGSLTGSNPFRLPSAEAANGEGCPALLLAVRAEVGPHLDDHWMNLDDYPLVNKHRP